MQFRPPIGDSDFRRIRAEQKSYIDKTRFIADVLDDARVVLFPRPRRFGKTLNLSTLRYFLERSDEDRTWMYQDLAIWGDARARTHFQRYPVIFLTLKDVKATGEQALFGTLFPLLERLFGEHENLLDVASLNRVERSQFEHILNAGRDPGIYSAALQLLSTALARRHGTPVAILIDEYDTPLHAAFIGGFYAPISSFMRNLLSGAFKDNPHLFKGVLTGILQVGKESLFSGLNNLKVYSILNDRYAATFGFTEADVMELLEQAERPALLEALRDTYNGYRFGAAEPVSLYNPWSVLMCLEDPGNRLLPWWLQTASDELLRDLMTGQGLGLSPDFEALLRNEALDRRIEESLVLQEGRLDAEALWSFLLFSGYLTPTEVRLEGMTVRARLTLPNKEVAQVYRDVFLRWLEGRAGDHARLEALRRALLTGDVTGLETLLGDILLHHMSSLDAAGKQPEKLYQGLILGLLVWLERDYEVLSNHEAGLGRADVLLKPRQAGQPGVVLELKVRRRDETPARSMRQALEQIRSRGYVATLEAAGARPVHALGVVFDGKRVWVGANITSGGKSEMSSSDQKEVDHEFPKGIGRPATRALVGAGFTTLQQLTQVREADLLKLHGVGPKAVGVLREALAARGWAFAGER